MIDVIGQDYPLLQVGIHFFLLRFTLSRVQFVDIVSDFLHDNTLYWIVTAGTQPRSAVLEHRCVDLTHMSSSSPCTHITGSCIVVFGSVLSYQGMVHPMQPLEYETVVPRDS